MARNKSASAHPLKDRSPAKRRPAAGARTKHAMTGRFVKSESGRFADFGEIQVVDPLIRPKRLKIETIRKAVREYYK